jgi:hypothetical protein
VFEPLEAWRRLARQLVATFRLAAQLQRGQVTPWLGPGAENWDSIGAADPKCAQYEAWIDEQSADRPLATAWKNPTSTEVLGLQRSAIARVLDLWLKFGGVQEKVRIAFVAWRSVNTGCPRQARATPISVGDWRWWFVYGRRSGEAMRTYGSALVCRAYDQGASEEDNSARSPPLRSATSIEMSSTTRRST